MEGIEGEWCGSCWTQLVDKGAETKVFCKAGGGLPHQFTVVKFNYKALGRVVQRECAEHRVPIL